MFLDFHVLFEYEKNDMFTVTNNSSVKPQFKLTNAKPVTQEMLAQKCGRIKHKLIQIKDPSQ